MGTYNKNKPKPTTIAHRVVKAVMDYVGYNEIKSFADAIGINYMIAYNCYNGRTKALTHELVYKIHDKYPEINIKFLEKGEGTLTDSPKLYSHNEQVLPADNNPEITLYDLPNILDRFLLLFERMEQRYQKLNEWEEDLKQREEKIKEFQSRYGMKPFVQKEEN